jgi:hypothetical protein
MIVHAMRPPQLQGPFALTNSENFELCSCHVQSRKCSFEGPMIFGLVRVAALFLPGWVRATLK